MGYLGSTVFIGAIGVGTIIISYLIFSFGFIKSITTGFVSQSTGSKDYESLFKSIYQLLFITILISVLILFFREKIIYYALNLVDGSQDVLNKCVFVLAEYRARQRIVEIKEEIFNCENKNNNKATPSTKRIIFL